MKDDIAIIHQALKAAKSLAFAQRRGGLHKLYHQLEEALKALKRIEDKVTTTQIPMTLFQTNTTDYKRGT